MCVSEGTLFTLILTAGLCVRVRRRETCVSEGYVALVHEQCDAGQLGGLLLQLTVGVRNGDATQSTSEPTQNTPCAVADAVIASSKVVTMPPVVSVLTAVVFRVAT